MELPYTTAQAAAAHDQWNAMCGHYSLAAATGHPLEDIRTAGVPLKGWMNPTMINETLKALKVGYQRFLLKELGYDVPQDLVKLPQINHGAILRIQWEGSWMNPGVPAGARYQRTHYIAIKDGTIMDPAFDPAISLRVEDWLQVVTNDIVPQIKGATGYHFTHVWIITPSPLSDLLTLLKDS